MRAYMKSRRPAYRRVETPLSTMCATWGYDALDLVREDPVRSHIREKWMKDTNWSPVAPNL